MSLLWNASTPAKNNSLQIPKGFDGGLFLGTDENVSADVTLTYSYTLGDGTPVSPHTWLTNNDRAITLDNAHACQAALAVFFNTVTFATEASRVDVTVTQQRTATDTVTAPLIGAGSITSDGITNTYPMTYEGLWATIPLSFLPYLEQPARAIKVAFKLYTTTLDTATLLLAPSVALSEVVR